MKSEANTDRIKLAAISLIPANPVIKAMQHFEIKYSLGVNSPAFQSSQFN